MTERTVVIVKPDGVQRGLIGQVIARLETKGLKLVGIKMANLTDEILTAHYAHIADKPFFPEVRNFMSSTPVILMCWEGLDCVATVRKMCGITKAREAESGTLRGDFAMSVQANIVHASDTPESAAAEVSRFFNSADLFEYDLILASFIYASHER